MNVNKNDFSLMDTVKFTVIGLLGSLIIGFVIYYLTQFSIYQYSLYANPGLTVFAFPVAVILSAFILAAYMNRNDSIVMGLLVGLLTGLLQSQIISLFMGKMSGAWFDTYIGSQVFLLIILGIAAAYFGNAFLKKRIN